MSGVEAALFGMARRHQPVLATVLRSLEGLAAAEGASGGRGLPREASELLSALWLFLAAYGARDEHGSVDLEPDYAPVAWRPGVDELGSS